MSRSDKSEIGEAMAVEQNSPMKARKTRTVLSGEICMLKYALFRSSEDVVRCWYLKM